MDITTILLSSLIGIITSIITAYVTARVSFRQETAKWERELARKLAELRSSDPTQANGLTRQFAVGYLIIEQPAASQREKVFVPPVGKLSIGRGAQNDVILSDEHLSRTHAVFTAKDGVVSIQDMGTASGVMLNGIRVYAVTKLKDGDALQMGNTHITFHKM